MLNAVITTPTIPVTASAELGRVGIANQSDFRQLATLDNGIVIRACQGLGTFRTSHVKSKELGGSIRHGIRLDLSQNGDLEPAFAQIMLCSRPTAHGTNRALEALVTLLGLLTFNNTAGTVPTGTASITDTLGDIMASACQADLINTLNMVLNGEG